MNRVLAAVGIFAALLLGVLALADELHEERTLSYDSGKAAGFERLPGEGARVDFEPVDLWEHVYLVKVSVFARRYGSDYDPAKTLANIAATDRSGKVLAQKLLPLSYFSESGDWVDVELSPIELTGPFSAVFYPYSVEGHGVEVGYAESSGSRRSWQGNPSKGFEPVEDGRDWMIRVIVRSSLAPRRDISIAEISGPQFRYYDDGKVDGYLTSQRGGALIAFRRDSARMLKEVYFFGKVRGDWFKLKPTFRVFLLDNDLRVLTSMQRDYTILTEMPHWTVIDFPDTPITTDFYILIEPVSRPAYALDIGYDSSGENRGSFYGTVGTASDWDVVYVEDGIMTVRKRRTAGIIELAQKPLAHENLNWMIRVEVG